MVSPSNSIDEREFNVEHPDLPITIPMEEEITIRLSYSPLNAGGDSTLFSSKVMIHPMQRWRCQSTTQSDLDLRPERLQFYSADGTTDSKRSRCIIWGQSTITEWALSEDSSDEFSIVSPSMLHCSGWKKWPSARLHTDRRDRRLWNARLLTTDSEIHRLTVNWWVRSPPRYIRQPN